MQNNFYIALPKLKINVKEEDIAWIRNAGYNTSILKPYISLYMPKILKIATKQFYFLFINNK
jgi:hypothetical protein